MALRFEELIKRHHDEIFAYLWRLMGNDRHRDGSMDVEDLTQDVFLRAYDSFAAMRSNGNHRAWLYKIATHCAYTQFRRMKHQRDQLSWLKHSVTELETASDDSSLRKDGTKRARPGYELSAKQKACVTLRYLQDLDYPEIDRFWVARRRVRAPTLSGDPSPASRPGGRKMTTQKSKNDVFVVKHLRSALGSPTETALSRSRERVRKWFAAEAPLIHWGEMNSPLGPLFVAINQRGLCALDFGRQESEFLERFDSRHDWRKIPKPFSGCWRNCVSTSLVTGPISICPWISHS